MTWRDNPAFHLPYNVEIHKGQALLDPLFKLGEIENTYKLLVHSNSESSQVYIGYSFVRIQFYQNMGIIAVAVGFTAGSSFCPLSKPSFSIKDRLFIAD